jgi:hypothetical protein
MPTYKLVVTLEYEIEAENADEAKVKLEDEELDFETVPHITNVRIESKTGITTYSTT